MNKIGLKWSLFMLFAPSLMGWALVLGAQNLGMMITGRVLQGMSLGAIYVVAPVYIAEISRKEIRGALGSFFQLLLAFGLLLVYTLGAFFSVFWLTLICTIFPLIFGIAFIFMPESPHYFIAKNEIEKAEKSLKWLRSKSYDYQKEIEELRVEEEKRKMMHQNSSLKQALARPESKKVLIIIIGLSFFQQFCGVNAVTFYTTDIFKVANSNIDPNVQTIIIGIMEVLVSLVPTFIVDKLGRKVFLISSGLGMAVSSITLGTYFFLNDNGFHVEQISWIPLAALSFYIITYCIGFGSVNFLVRSEICAPDIKGFAVGLALTITWFFAFVIIKFYINLVDLINVGPTFWMYGILCVFSAGFVYFVLPEIKGKSLAEIQRMLVNTK